MKKTLANWYTFYLDPARKLAGEEDHHFPITWEGGGLGELGTDQEEEATLGGNEQRSITQIYSLSLDNWTLL